MAAAFYSASGIWFDAFRQPCHACSGSGTLRLSWCRACGGTGVRTVEEPPKEAPTLPLAHGAPLVSGATSCQEPHEEPPCGYAAQRRERAGSPPCGAAADWPMSKAEAVRRAAGLYELDLGSLYALFGGTATSQATQTAISNQHVLVVDTLA